MATVLANGSLSSKTSGEGEIRKNLIEADLVECIVAMPDKLFYTTGIPVSIWFLTKDKTAQRVKSERPQRDRRGEILFVDARQMGIMATRTVRELSDDEIMKISETYNAWRGEPGLEPYEDVTGFCASIKLVDVRAHDHVLTPGRYVGIEDSSTDVEPTSRKIQRLIESLEAGFATRSSLQVQALSALKLLDARGADD
jgi:type I restriction enzyme M protein